MRRPVAVLMAVALAFSLSSMLLAGQPEKQRPKKKTVTGTIVKVNAKKHTIAVKPVTGQQIQTQKSQQKEEEADKPKKKKKDRPLVIHVDAKTQITSRVPQQQAAKGNSQTQQDESKFKMLRAGQLVRIVYQPKVLEPVEQKEKPKPDQEQKEEPKPDQKQKGKPKPDQDQDQKDKPKPDQKRKRVLRAIKIEILKKSAQQQQQTPGQDG